LSLKLKGFPIRDAQAFLERIQNEQRTNFESYIESSKQAIVNHHLKHNPFYKDFAKYVNPEDWNSLPVMTKSDLQQPLQQRLSDGYSSKNIFINKTSGSSGTPFSFAKDKFCHALIWANFMDRYSWFNLNLNHSKQARFYGIPLNKKEYYKERFKDALSHRFRFSVFDLSDSQLEKNLEKFSKTKFHYIYGYTSAIVQFAKYLKQQQIVLKTVCPSLQACIVTSEMLFHEDKTLLEVQFDIPVINEYGAAELGLIAFQNQNNEWLINTEDLFVEILDENNNVLPYGEAGRIVITSFYNKAHPFIRYDLGDIGIISKTSRATQPILEKLIGRTSDLIKLPSGKKAAGLTFYYVTKKIIDNDGHVKEFIVEQLKLDTFKISYTSTTPLSEKYLIDIKKAISKYLEPNLTVIFERQQTLKRSKSGKLKQFKSYLS